MNEPQNQYGKPLRFFTDENQIVSDGLFLERNSAESWTQFTLMPWDMSNPNNPNKPLPSIHRLYVEAEDLSEYDFATEHFYNFAHWEFIKSREWFVPHYNAMRNELEAKLESKATRGMLNQITSGTATQSTLKYFADKEYHNPTPDKTDTPKPDKDWLLNQATKTFERAMKSNNLAAANVALKTIGQHTSVDAFAANQIELTAPINVIINGDLSKV
jgi:hypothetical protein